MTQKGEQEGRRRNRVEEVGKEEATGEGRQRKDLGVGGRERAGGADRDSTWRRLWRRLRRR